MNKVSPIGNRPVTPINEEGGNKIQNLLPVQSIEKTLIAKQGAIRPIISMVLRNLWGRDILEDMGAILSTDDKVFFDDFQVHEKKGLANHDHIYEWHSQF